MEVFVYIINFVGISFLLLKVCLYMIFIGFAVEISRFLYNLIRHRLKRGNLKS